MSIFSQILQYLFSGLANGSVYALIALGFNIIYSATGIINFAQGEFVVLGGFISYTLINQFDIPAYLAFPITILAVSIIGVMFERIAIHPLRKPSVMTLIIITIGGSMLFRGITMLTWGKEPIYMDRFSKGINLNISGAIIDYHTLWIIGITLSAVAVLYFFFEKTITGKAIRACSEDREASALMGINVDRVVMMSFALSAALGALAGIVYTPIASMEYDRGALLGIKGFIVAIIGGLGNQPGAVIAGLLLGIIENFCAGFLTSTFKEPITLAILLIVLFVRPSGILGRADLAKFREF